MKMCCASLIYATPFVGWFTHSHSSPCPALEYDWYGAYGNEVHDKHEYNDRVNQGLTFSYPEYHDNVRYSVLQLIIFIDAFRLLAFILRNMKVYLSLYVDEVRMPVNPD